MQTMLTFSEALIDLKNGKRVARAGWNGKGMWIALQPGSLITKEQCRGGAALLRAKEFPDTDPPTQGMVQINAHLDMRTADGSICCGWLASQADMLAEDWLVVE